jgi:hypothetical protein
MNSFKGQLLFSAVYVDYFFVETREQMQRLHDFYIRLCRLEYFKRNNLHFKVLKYETYFIF